MSELNESLSLGRSDIIGALGLTFWRLQIKQFWIIDLASFFPLVIKNDKICSLPVCKFFKCKSNKINLDIICFPLRMIGCLKSNGSSTWCICPQTLIMFSCNSGFKDKMLLFDDTVLFWVNNIHPEKIQPVLNYRFKSFGDKYGKSVVLIMQRFLFTHFVLSFIIHAICLTNLFQEE